MEYINGKIIKSQFDVYTIKIKNKIVLAKQRGKLKFNKTKPLVGDNVLLSFEKPNNYWIEKIKERINKIDRPEIANINQTLIVSSIVEPNLSTLLIDKFLIIMESRNIKPILIFTKKDLAKNSDYLFVVNSYKKNNYETFIVNSLENKIDPKLKKILNNKLTLITGQTGVGKSTLINLLNPDLELKTQEISKALNRGKHTTRYTEIFNVFDNAYVVDTPGFSSLEIDNLSLEEMANSFHDFEKASQKCKFRNCLHISEKNCKVKKLVQEKKISKERYENYLKIINEKNSKIKVLWKEN